MGRDFLRVLHQEPLELLCVPIPLDGGDHGWEVHADVAAEVAESHLVAISPDDAGRTARATQPARVGERITSRASLHGALVVVTRRARAMDATVIRGNVLDASEVEAGVAVAGFTAVVADLARRSARGPRAAVSGTSVAAVGRHRALSAVSAVAAALDGRAFPASARRAVSEIGALSILIARAAAGALEASSIAAGRALGVGPALNVVGAGGVAALLSAKASNASSASPRVIAVAVVDARATALNTRLAGAAVADTATGDRGIALGTRLALLPAWHRAREVNAQMA